jgi:hypothetical protein
MHAPEQTEVSARECLDYLVIFNERHLRRVFTSYLDYYHRPDPSFIRQGLP